MSKETLVSDGRFGAAAGEVLTPGMPCYIKNDGTLYKADGGEKYVLIALKDTAVGDRAACAKPGDQVYALVDGTTNVAIGDLLETAADSLVKVSTGTPVAVALEARTADSVGQVLVLLL